MNKDLRMILNTKNKSTNKILKWNNIIRMEMMSILKLRKTTDK